MREDHSCDSMPNLGWQTQDDLKMCVTRCAKGGAGIAIFRDNNNNCKCCDTSASLWKNTGSNAYAVEGKMILLMKRLSTHYFDIQHSK